MPCYWPLVAWRGPLNPSGKRSIVFKERDACVPGRLELPCSQCVGCRLERSRQWAMRCLHESSLYEDNCFVTLTFDDDHLPPDGSIQVRDIQLFNKRLRKRFSNSKIRFFACGEYGDKLGRPHYHICYFNFNFPDRYYWKTQNGFALDRSPILEELWTFGHCLVGDVTFDSAAYVARYIMKKVTGDRAVLQYSTIDFSTGEILSTRVPEFVRMSRGGRGGLGGIGRSWFNRFKSDIYPDDFAVINGKKVRPPKFYDGLYEVSNPNEFSVIKADRVANAKLHAGDNTLERLRIKEQVKLSRIRLLHRPLEAGNVD